MLAYHNILWLFIPLKSLCQRSKVEMCVSHNMKCASVVIEDELLCFDNGTTVPGLSPEYSLGKSKFI